MYCAMLWFADLSVDNRVGAAVTADTERQSCSDGAVSVSVASEDVEAVNRNGSVDIKSSRCRIESLPHKPDSPPVSAASTSAPLSPDSSSMRHSASDSQVYRADVEFASSYEVLPGCPQTEQTAGSAGLNGHCKAVEETQVCLV